MEAHPDSCDNGRMEVCGQRRVGATTVALSALLVAFLAGCKGTAPPTPLADLNAPQAHGHAVFQTRCAACHYDRVDGPLHGPSLLGVYKKPSLPSGAPANDERVTATIVHGRNLMPALGNTLDAQEIDDLLAYLHTL